MRTTIFGSPLRASYRTALLMLIDLKVLVGCCSNSNKKPSSCAVLANDPFQKIKDG